MQRFGLVELEKGEAGALMPSVPYGAIRLEVVMGAGVRQVLGGAELTQGPTLARKEHDTYPAHVMVKPAVLNFRTRTGSRFRIPLAASP